MLSVPRAHFIRFPGNEVRFARLLDAQLPADTGFDPTKITYRDTEIPHWAADIWRELESRCLYDDVAD